MPRYHSRFGGLWLDRLDAHRILLKRVEDTRLTAEDLEMGNRWMRDGFLELPGAVSVEAIDRFTEALTLATTNDDGRFLATVEGLNDNEMMPLQSRFLTMSTLKVLDTHYHLPEARALLLSPPILKTLKFLFDASPLLFHSLTFIKGSEQWHHQDAVYVKVDPPVNFAAVWIALEDVHEGSGELLYVPGSHRISEYLFGKTQKHWYPWRDGHEEHESWRDHMNTEIQSRGLEVKSFLPRRGDAFIWHAELIHGGKAIKDPSLSRRSIVGHYCPVFSRPECLWSKTGQPNRTVGRFSRQNKTQALSPANDRRIHAEGEAFFLSSYYREDLTNGPSRI